MKNYIILKGFHYSNFFPNICLLKNNKVFEKTFMFNESCKYNINEPSCVNKLFGFCFGLFGVHKNSIRFGWTYDNLLNKICIWSYFYKDGKLYKNKIFLCNLNETHTYKIEIYKNQENHKFRFIIDNKTYDFQEITSNKKFLLTLGPYFGGNTRAPHTIKIIKI